MPAKDFYVAIELGSSKITGIAGQKRMDGSINVLAVATEPSATCIRKGVVYNIDKTNQCIRNIVQKLQNTLQTEIRLVHVGIGGQGIRSVANTLAVDFDEATVVNHATIDNMMDGNRNTRYPNQTKLDVAPQEYKVDSQYQIDPVGIECNRIEGNFLNIVWRDAFCRNLYKCFEQNGMPEPRYYLTQMALADNILSDTEKRTGCVLVDLGAGTTTVSIYYKNILRHMVTIPLGGNNITKDITSFHIDEMEAEKLKLKHAAAYTNSAEVDPEMKISIDPQRTIPYREFVNLVEARVEEIIKNVLAQIPSDYIDKIGGGIVLTGGGVNLKNMETTFRKYSNIERVRVAKTINSSVNTAKSISIENDATLCAALSLLHKADEISSGRPLSEVNNLFSVLEEEQQSGETVVTREPATKRPGQVLTRQEREAEEEEARKRAEEDQKKKEEEDAQKRAEEEEKRKQNSFMTKMKKNIISFGKKVFEPED